MPTSRPEILAPAGGPRALDAALAAGADAVYFGLKQLNARRGAENFLPETLEVTVAAIHARGARAYLTLNIDLSQRELGQAARILELSRRAKIDAILIRDPALLSLIPFFPELEFHFSTQAGIVSSAGCAAAKTLGVRRVVLARELSLEEIRAAAAVPGVEVEVFVQGALCFGVSGRCLLSSWVGGRSGNRGTCTSPCRVPWSVDGSLPGKPLSMHDLGLAGRLPELAAAGVAAFKIEGRLKSPDWVARAVRLHREALLQGLRSELAVAAESLGAYTGRSQTDGYLDARRARLTGDSGRLAAAEVPAAEEDESGTETRPAAAAIVRTVTVTAAPDPKGGLLWTFRTATLTRELRTPPQTVKHEDRSVFLTELGGRLTSALPKPWDQAEFVCQADPALRLPRSTANQLDKDFAAFLRAAAKESDGTVRLDLPQDIREFLAAAAAVSPAAPVPPRTLGEPPDRARLDPDPAQVRAFAAAFPAVTILAECLTAAGLDALLAAVNPQPDLTEGAKAQRKPLSGVSVSISPSIQNPKSKIQNSFFLPTLPAVFYEAQIPGLRSLLERCRELGFTVEVNSWDGWMLAKDAGVAMTAGPGLAVLNALAARTLHNLGCVCATVSPEADHGQIEDLCAAAGIPLSLAMFGRPPLMQTRVEFLPEITVGQGALFKDARGGEMRPRREGAVAVFRPVTPFDWSTQRNPQIRVAHLVADFSASPDPVREFRTLACLNPRHLFNYDRTLR